MMPRKKAQRPIDVKDMPWSYMGKEALDAAAERLWNGLRDAGQMHNARGRDMGPYHVQSSASQLAAQRAVLDMLGSDIAPMLKRHAKAVKADGGSADDVYYLNDLADDLEADHG